MQITRENYESYFIDYFDGKLDENMIDDFLEFLQQNPDLKEELSFFEHINLEKEEITFEKKEHLIKEKYDSEKEFNKAVIADLEGEISEFEKSEFISYISKHPEKQTDIKLFSLTKLKPDTSISFAKKNKILKHPKRSTIVLWSARVAAVLILALSVYFFIDYSTNQIKSESKVAEVSKKITEEKSSNPEEIAVPKQKEKKAPVTNIKKESKKPVIKKAAPTKSEQPKSLRENTKGRLEKDDLAVVRPDVEIPDQLASLYPVIQSGIPNSNLGRISYHQPETISEIPEEKYFVDMVREKASVEKINVDKIRDAGLEMVTNISKEKFLFKRNEEGKVTEVNYDSGFLAFSIPTRKKAKRNSP